MVRLVGVDLPPNKRLIIGLTYIYGIGDATSKAICEKTGVDPSRKSKDLTDGEVVLLREAIKNYAVEGDLRKDVSMAIKRLVEIGTYRGTRHRKGLPCRGQRSRTNGRTKRGKRKTVGLGRKKEEEKT